MEKEITAMYDSREYSGCVITDSEVYERVNEYDDYSGVEREVIRYVKDQQLVLDQSFWNAREYQTVQGSLEDVAWIVSVASVGAAVYLAVTEGPDLIRSLHHKVKEWFK